MPNADAFAVCSNALFNRCFDFPIIPSYNYIILFNAVIFNIFGCIFFVPMMKDGSRIGLILGGFGKCLGRAPLDR
jgi:hypothetical protein